MNPVVLTPSMVNVLPSEVKLTTSDENKNSELCDLLLLIHFVEKKSMKTLGEFKKNRLWLNAAILYILFKTLKSSSHYRSSFIQKWKSPKYTRVHSVEDSNELNSAVISPQIDSSKCNSVRILNIAMESMDPLYIDKK